MSSGSRGCVRSVTFAHAPAITGPSAEQRRWTASREAGLAVLLRETNAWLPRRTVLGAPAPSRSGAATDRPRSPRLHSSRLPVDPPPVPRSGHLRTPGLARGRRAESSPPRGRRDSRCCRHVRSPPTSTHPAPSNQDAAAIERTHPYSRVGRGANLPVSGATAASLCVADGAGVSAHDGSHGSGRCSPSPRDIRSVPHRAVALKGWPPSDRKRRPRRAGYVVRCGSHRRGVGHEDASCWGDPVGDVEEFGDLGFGTEVDHGQ
jgi:hypothetical protein